MARMVRLNTEAMARRIIARTKQIKVGRTYFLSSFSDIDGAMVKVLSKSTELNGAGWPSKVEYEVISKVGDSNSTYYAPGKRGTCNARNLYDTIEDASPARRLRR